MNPSGGDPFGFSGITSCANQEKFHTLVEREVGSSDSLDRGCSRLRVVSEHLYLFLLIKALELEA